MPLLIGFVNRFYAPRLSLAVADPTSNDVWWVARPDVIAAARGSKGINGICRYGEHWVMGLQSTPTRLVVLDRRFAVVGSAEIGRVRELHSLCPTPSGLLMVSTGTDEICRAEILDSFRVSEVVQHWSAEPGVAGLDRHHVNSVAMVGSEVLATMFGPKAGRGWSTAKQGRLFEVSSGKTLLAPLHHPHTVHALDDQWIVCESATGKLHFQDGRVLSLGGYVRGLTHDAGDIFIGVSGARLESRSEGTLNLGTASPASTRSCEVCVVDRSSLELKRRLDLSAFGSEIFELAWFDDAIPEDLMAVDQRQLLVDHLKDQVLHFSKKAQEEWISQRVRRLARNGWAHLTQARDRFARAVSLGSTPSSRQPNGKSAGSAAASQPGREDLGGEKAERPPDRKLP